MRKIVWFSCGAASAVAAKMLPDATPVYCDTLSNEHSDNARFMRDVENWIGKKILIIKSEKFSSIEDVAEKTRYMAGINGARCTTELKKIPRRNFQESEDIHTFGFTFEESKRICDFSFNNPELKTDFVLQRLRITKNDCFKILSDAGIVLPKMYALGFRNNNCIGCFKATSITYWKLVKQHFPEIFQKRVEQSRKLNVRLTRLHGVRIFLDEIPNDSHSDEQENVSCGPECGQS